MRVGDGRFQRGIEELAVGKLSQRISQVPCTCRLKALLQHVDLELGGVELLFQLLVGEFHFLGRAHKGFNGCAHALAVLRLLDLLGHAGEAFSRALGEASGDVDHRHDRLDLILDFAVHRIDAVGQMRR